VMQPKSRGRPKKILHPDGSTEQVFDIISIGDSSDSSVVMTGKKPVSRGKGKGKAKASSSAVPDVYRDMLAEALPMQSDVPERPLKRRRTGRRNGPSSSSNVPKADAEQDNPDEEENIEFEDVLDQEMPSRSDNEASDAPPKPQQTAYRESDDDSASEFDWEAIDFDAKPQEEPSGDLELTLIKRPTPQRKTTATRRKVVTKEERALRLQIHKMHVLCLLAYVDRRNDWCSDSEAQSSLKPLLTKKMLTFLRPRSDLSQFGRADSLKRGLDDVAKLWRTKFSMTARGMRRSLWADDEKDLQNVSKPRRSCDFQFNRI
jgi:xeroderma pigmentosum group C-complementing protein